MKRISLIAMGCALALVSISAGAAICGVAEEFPFIAGQNIDVGTITVSNDEDFVYVEYFVDAPWWLTETHVYALDEEPMSRLVPGKALYKSGDISYTDSCVVAIPLADAVYDEACRGNRVLWIQAHAAIVRYDEDGNIVKGETAYGGDIDKPKRGSWYGNIMYEVKCCDDTEGEDECGEETAFGGDTAGDGSAWWFYYDNSVGGVQTIWAGQTISVGTVEVVDHTLVIALTGGWELQNVDEAVKIQGYDDPPGSRPAAGQFTHYKGNSLTVALDSVWNYYVIHLDVQLCE